MDADLDQDEHHDVDDHGDGDHEDSHEAHDSNSISAVLAGFLFGNIDERGELEEDFLDEVCGQWNSLTNIKYEQTNGLRWVPFSQTDYKQTNVSKQTPPETQIWNITHI